MISKENILPSITTTRGFDWRAKIKEADGLGLDTVALFLTCLDKAGREELYGLLAKSKIKRIPFVHLRSDMPAEELEFLIKKYQTKVFNIHCSADYPSLFDLSAFSSKIYMENTACLFQEAELKKFAGFCIDFSHLENDRILQPERYRGFCEMISRFAVGCNHISAIQKKTHFDENINENGIVSHFMESLSDLDYLKNYPQGYFSKYIALELENDLAIQLKAKDYIFDLLAVDKCFSEHR
ncbi:MAG: hypothetical protein WCX77_03155 [Candidatus Paceibacterota bacterium]|jgi:hypothetical protein